MPSEDDSFLAKYAQVSKSPVGSLLSPCSSCFFLERHDQRHGLSWQEALRAKPFNHSSADPQLKGLPGDVVSFSSLSNPSRLGAVSHLLASKPSMSNPPSARASGEDEAVRTLAPASARALSRVGARYRPSVANSAVATVGGRAGSLRVRGRRDTPPPAAREKAAAAVVDIERGAATRRPRPRRAARVVGGAIDPGAIGVSFRIALSRTVSHREYRDAGRRCHGCPRRAAAAHL